MREKICSVLNKIYGVSILVSLFAGLLPIIPFIIAIVIGGETGANISVFLYKQYYPWIAVLASVAVVVGLISMYIGKHITFSLPNWMKPKKKAKNENSIDVQQLEENKSES